MNKLSKVVLFMILFSLLLPAGCKQKKEMARIFGKPKGLSRAAQETYLAYHQQDSVEVRSFPQEDIPEQYWTGLIRALKPLRVYTHRANVVVALKVHNYVEEGVYIYIPISSYIPISGSDGFVFSDLVEDCYMYKKSIYN
jgi:hypothetical protein